MASLTDGKRMRIARWCAQRNRVRMRMQFRRINPIRRTMMKASTCNRIRISRRPRPFAGPGMGSRKIVPENVPAGEHKKWPFFRSFLPSFSLSFCLSVCLSVCLPSSFFLFFKFWQKRRRRKCGLLFFRKWISLFHRSTGHAHLRYVAMVTVPFLKGKLKQNSWCINSLYNMLILIVDEGDSF